MASSKFQERFKDKISTISKLGQLSVDRSQAIVKQELPLSQKPQFKSTASFILKYSSQAKQPQSQLRGQESGRHSILSELPKRKLENPGLTSGLFETTHSVEPLRRRKIIDFVPYTLRDYKVLKSEKYYKLGGLGADIGSEDWRGKVQSLHKRLSYAQRANFSNLCNMTAKRPEPDFQAISARERAWEFAKTIQKPPLKVNDNS